MSKKNILFFMTDQFLWNALGYVGHPIVKTPNLDRLAAKSFNFPNTYCASPVCVPARISLFCGQYAHKHGQATNLQVKQGTPMFIDTLNDNGYHTAAIGKLHLKPIERETKRFQTLKLHDGYSQKGSSAYAEYLEQEKPEYAPTDMHAFPVEEKEGVIFGENIYNNKKFEAIIYGTSKVPSEYFYTQWMSDESIKFLESHNKEKPFFLFSSFIGPHSPFVVPEPYSTMYKPEDVILPGTIEEDLSLKPKSQDFRRNMWGMGTVNEQQLRKITALYYGHITLIDEHIGRILDKLDETGLADNTLIAFSADHGELLGSHGQFYKGNMYDEATRIPLLIHDPAKNSFQFDEFVSQIDIMPTLLELADIPVPEWSQGKSFKPLIEGKPFCPRDQVFFEIKSVNDGLGGYPPSGYRIGCRDKEYLFSYEFYDFDNRRIHEGELYDLRNDPYQTHNLYSQPEYADKVIEFKERVLNWFMATQ